MGILLKDCFYCGGKNQAMVCVFTQAIPQQRHRAFFHCPGCNGPFAVLTTGPANNRNLGPDQPGLLEAIGVKVLEWHPDHPPLGAPAHTPDDVAQRFIEGESNFREGRMISASAMFRSVLDIATKKVCDDNERALDLFSRIQSLAARHVITATMQDWAHQIRKSGNDALHQEGVPTKADVEPLRLFTEMTLKYLFELPGEVTARRARAAQTP